MSRPDPRQEPAGLIVVGASVGGLAAAVMAADRGCRTIVVERGKELGGGAAPDAETIAASGSRFQRDAGVRDSPDRFAADILAASRHHVDRELALARGEHCPAVGALPYFGWPGSTGEALRLGSDVGAQTRHLDGCLVTPFLAMPGAVAVTAPLVDLGAILVNQAGRRFADETAERLVLATAVRAQPGHVAYLLFDERIATAARAADPFFARIVLPRTGRRAMTLEALSKQFEMDMEGLTLTVDTFNGNIELGGDPFGRERFGGPLEPPFHAIRVTGARWRTFGGLAVDRPAHVLDAAGRPIPGLYAAGGAAEGLGGDGTEGWLPGTDTLAALALGRLAALDVVAQASAAAAEPAR